MTWLIFVQDPLEPEFQWTYLIEEEIETWLPREKPGWKDLGKIWMREKGQSRFFQPWDGVKWSLRTGKKEASSSGPSL